MHTYIIVVNGDQSVKYAENIDEAVRQWADINSDIKNIEDLFSEFDHVTITKQPMQGNEGESCGDECSVCGLLLNLYQQVYELWALAVNAVCNKEYALASGTDDKSRRRAQKLAHKTLRKAHLWMGDAMHTLALLASNIEKESGIKLAPPHREAVEFSL
jgi:hypothetical protein